MHFADCVACLKFSLYHPIMGPHHQTFYSFICIFYILNTSESGNNSRWIFPTAAQPVQQLLICRVLWLISVHMVDTGRRVVISPPPSRHQAQTAASTGWDFMYICSSQPSPLSLPHVVTPWTISAMACSWCAGLLDRDWWEELHANH